MIECYIVKFDEVAKLCMKYDVLMRIGITAAYVSTSDK
jgi:hypothetical protein